MFVFISSGLWTPWTCAPPSVLPVWTRYTLSDPHLVVLVSLSFSWGCKISVFCVCRNPSIIKSSLPLFILIAFYTFLCQSVAWYVMLSVRQISPEPAAYQASSWSTSARLFRNRRMMKMTKPTYRAPPGWAAKEKDGYEFHGMTSQFSFHNPSQCSFLFLFS